MTSAFGNGQACFCLFRRVVQVNRFAYFDQHFDRKRNATLGQHVDGSWLTADRMLEELREQNDLASEIIKLLTIVRYLNVSLGAFLYR